MKRRVAMAVVFLALGAIVNVAVAWVCVLFSGTSHDSDTEMFFVDRDAAPKLHMRGRFGMGWERIAWAVPGTHSPSKFVFVIDGVEYPPRAILLDAPPRWQRFDYRSLEAGDGYVAVVEDARGWPLLALSSVSSAAEMSVVKSDGLIVEVNPFNLYLSAMAGIVPMDARVLPVQPIWPGFAMNSLLYAVVLWMIFTTPLAMRRTLRRKRRLCDSCAYPIGVSPVCTECGTPVALRSD